MGVNSAFTVNCIVLWRRLFYCVIQVSNIRYLLCNFAGVFVSVMRRQNKDVLEQLDKVIADSDLASSPQMSAFLRYVVEAKLKGEEQHIKAYTVGVEALGKKESFDPQSDPVVRVLAARLRKAIELYYATTGKNDPVIISFVKGSYVPAFTFAVEQIADEQNTASETDHEIVQDDIIPAASQPLFFKSWFFTGATVCIILILGAMLANSLGMFSLTNDGDNLNHEAMLEPPIVEVLSFETINGDNDTVAVAESFRRQLIADLSHFRRLRVRDGSSSEEKNSGLKAADYIISSYFMETYNQLQFTIGVSDQSSQHQVWSKSITFDTTDRKYNELMLQSVRHVVAQLASISGLLHAEAMKRLEERASKSKNNTVSSYECMIKFHTFDLRKRHEDGIAAKKCLDDLVQGNTNNASVWAAKALFTFFDWSHAVSAPPSMLDDALQLVENAIRLDPADSFGYEVKSYILMNQGDHDTAAETIQRARELNPSKPNLLILEGRNTILRGDWEKGTDLIKEAIMISPAPPGWFRIPLVFDAFRRGKFARSLSHAKEMIRAGDKRGYILAIAACSKLGNFADAAKYITQYEQMVSMDYSQSLDEFRKTFNTASVIEEYERVLVAEGLIK